MASRNSCRPEPLQDRELGADGSGRRQEACADRVDVEQRKDEEAVVLARDPQEGGQH